MLGRLVKLRDLAPLFLRLSIGAVGIYHGHGKLFGDMHKFEASVAHLGFPMPALFAWAAALSEFLGGIFLALGLLTRWAALFFGITMGVAVFRVHWGQPFTEYEYAMVLLAGCAALLLTGGGWLSLDRHLIGKEL